MIKIAYTQPTDSGVILFDDEHEACLFDDMFFHETSGYYLKPRSKPKQILVVSVPEQSLKKEKETKKTEQIFSNLAEKWYIETLHSSAYLDKVLHPAYQRIIGLGKDVIPFILCELQDEPSEWFWALRALTGEDPTTKSMAGKRDKMAKAWINWGKENGYI